MLQVSVWQSLMTELSLKHADMNNIDNNVATLIGLLSSYFISHSK